MGIRSIETAAGALAKLTEEYSELLNKFDKNINDRMQILQIQMELTEKRQKRFDQPIDLMLQTGMIAGAFFAGPLGLAIGQAMLQTYRISKSDGSLQQKMVNSLIAAAKSQAVQLIPDILTTKEDELTKEISNWRGYTPNFDLMPDTFENSYNDMNTLEQIAMYGGSYSAGTTVDSFLNAIPNRGGLEQVGASSEKYSSGFSASDEGDITLALLKSANRDMALRILQIQAILNEREKYKTITYYYGLSMATQNISIRSSHLGLKSREIIQLFYSGGMAQTVEDKYSQAQKNNEDPVEAAKAARKALSKHFQKQVNDSEIFAQDTNYNRVYNSFSLEENAGDWAKIDYKNQKNSSYYFYKHVKLGQNHQAPSFNEAHKITSESFFKLLDAKILVRAYFNDYADYFRKKIAGNLKKSTLYQYMPNNPAAIQKRWKNLSSTLSNDSRVRDLIVIYFLITIPQILLGAPITSQLINNHKPDAEGQDLEKIEIERIYAALYNGVWSACCFYKQMRPKESNWDIWARVAPFIDKISILLFSPFGSPKPRGDNIGDQDQLAFLGLTDRDIIGGPDGDSIDTRITTRQNTISGYLDGFKNDFSNLSPFVKATTPGMQKRTEVYPLERTSKMHDADLYNFDQPGNRDDNKLSAKFINEKLIEKIKRYIRLDQAKIPNFESDDLFEKLPKKDNKFSYKADDADMDRKSITDHFSALGVKTDNYVGDKNDPYLDKVLKRKNNNQAPNFDANAIREKMTSDEAIDNLLLQQKFGIEALLMNKASQAEVLKYMHKTITALAAKIIKE